MERRHRLVGLAMVGLGSVQTVYAITQSDPVFAGLGGTYGVLGGLSLWLES